MPLRFNCEQCDVKIKVPDGSEGKKVKCPSCGHAQRVQLEPVQAPQIRVMPTRPMAVTSATPPKAMDRPATEQPRQRRAEERPAKAQPPAPVEAEEAIVEAEPADDLSALASAVSEAAPQPVAEKPVPPAARLPRAPRDARSANRGKSQNRREQPAETSSDRTVDDAPARREEADEAAPLGGIGEAIANDRENEAARAAELARILPPNRAVGERTAEESEALAAFLREPEPAPAPARRVPAATPVESLIASAQAETNVTEQAAGSGSIEAVADDSDRDIAPPAASTSTVSETESSKPAEVPALPVVTLEASSGESDAGAAATDIAAVVSPAGVSAANVDDGGEAPAGEVRDLFDDFVRREELERQAEAAKESKRKATESRREDSRKEGARKEEARREPQPSRDLRDEEDPALEPTPVVVVRTVPPVRRAGAKPATEGAAPSPSEAPSNTPEPAVVGAAAVSTPAPALPAVAIAPAAAPRAPQAIPLASPPPAASPASPAGATMKIVGVPTADEDAAADAQHNPIARLSAAVAGQAAAPPRAESLEPPPAYALLLVICWMLRMLACLSVVSVTKLLLVWSDAGASAFDILIVLPLGLGVAGAIWGVGEVARVTRDAARGGPHR